MSNRELAKSLIDQISENKLPFIIAYLQGATIPEKIPNIDTLEAMKEIEEMIQTGKEKHFQGTAEDFTDMLVSNN